MKNIICLPDYGDDDVISFRSCIHKVSKFKSAVDVAFADNKIAYEASNALQSKVGVSSLEWFEHGVNCEILRIGGESWQKGRLKITINVEFFAEELVVEQKTESNQVEINQPESMIDDTHRVNDQNGQQNNTLS